MKPLVLVLAGALVIAIIHPAGGFRNIQIQSRHFRRPDDPGKPDSDGVTTNMYKNPTGEYIAVVQFLKGHSVAEAYSRVDSRKLSEKELSIFLEGNSAGKEWKKDPGGKFAWERERSPRKRIGPKRSRDDPPSSSGLGNSEPVISGVG